MSDSLSVLQVLSVGHRPRCTSVGETVMVWEGAKNGGTWPKPADQEKLGKIQ